MAKQVLLIVLPHQGLMGIMNKTEGQFSTVGQ